MPYTNEKAAHIRARWIEGAALRQLRFGLTYRQIASVMSAISSNISAIPSLHIIEPYLPAFRPKNYIKGKRDKQSACQRYMPGTMYAVQV